MIAHNVLPVLAAASLVAASLAGCAGPAHETPRPSVLRSADAREIPFPGHAMRVLLDAGGVEGDVAVFEITVPPRTLGAPPHVHQDEDESFYVLEGELVFLSDEDEQPCGPGTVVNLPRGHVHGFWNATDAPARALLTMTPARFAGFFDDAVAELRERGAMGPEAVGALLTEVAARYGCEVRGASVGPIVQRYGLR